LDCLYSIIKNFVDLGLNEAYKRVTQFGTKPAEIESIIAQLGIVPSDNGRAVLYCGNQHVSGVEYSLDHGRIQMVLINLIKILY